MRWHSVWTIFKKELVDALRDRRTIFSMIVFPVVLSPALMLIMPKLFLRQVKKEEERASKVAVIGKGELAERVRRSDKLEIVQTTDFLEAIRERKIDAAVVIPDDFEEGLRALKRPKVALYRDSTELSSRMAERKLVGVITLYVGEIGQRALQELKVDLSKIPTFETEMREVASQEKQQGALLATVLPYILIFLCLTGAMYVAIDLTTGEKERGTLETLLVSPALRLEIVAGKFVTVFFASLVTAALAAASTAVTLVLSGPTSITPTGPRLEFSASFGSLMLLMVLLLPIAATFSALLMCVSLFARSYKEAMSYLTPLMLFVVVPAFISMIPGVQANLGLALIPVANASLGMREVLKGELDWAYLGVTFLSSAVIALVSLLLAARLFLRESVLFRSA